MKAFAGPWRQPRVESRRSPGHRYRGGPAGYQVNMQPSGIDDWLQVELQSQGSTWTLILSGALRGTSIAALEAQVDQLGATSCEEVVIDVRRLTEMDAVGASVVLGLYHYVVAKGGRLRIVGATGRVATAFTRPRRPDDGEETHKVQGALKNECERAGTGV